MKEKFREIVDVGIPELEEKKFLLAVSGGIDSVVLAHLFYESRLNFSIAHFNFSLRGEESDRDEQLVQHLAENYDARFFIRKADTVVYAEEKGISIQMAARELRYEWFYELCRQNKLDYIVTAHHRNDQVETFFINLARGTGIEGLTGMKTTDGKLFRPLLGFSKQELENYAQTHHLSWRDDESNNSVKYQRNKIRLDIIPKLEELNSAFIQNTAECMERLNAVNIIYKQFVEEKRQQFVVKNDFGWEIDLQQLKKEKIAIHLLYEMLRPYNFHSKTVKDIFEERKKETGKKFFSTTHRVVNHRGILLITKLIAEDLETFQIHENDEEVLFPVKMKIEKLPKGEIIKSDKIVQLDYDKIRFPVMIRKWYRGDSFFPLGMKGRKKLSDFFIDNKYSLVEKENIYVLVSGDQVIWVIGKRLDDRFKITEQTSNILQLTLL
ncbi:MAG: tRNA lysidine(34) synthetase TilS [Bacteroidota bacterium]